MADDTDEGPVDGLADDAIDPAKEPKSSRAWLTMITDATKVFSDWQDKSDNIDKLYASLEKLSSLARDRQFQLFWANIAVVGPSVYSRPPVPVVVPRFKDRKPLPRAASELLERTTIVAFELEDIDSVMRAIRDDLIILARGAAWVRYDADKKGEYLTERVCIEHVDRKDFLHEAQREWKDVDWVAKASWMTKAAMRKRFTKTSGKAYQDAGFEKRKDDKQADDGKLKARVWELWCKSANKVVWVTEGVDVVLDEGKPHLTLDGFFPCPRPVYATTQRRTLIPVPDMLFYKDQLEEINELTARIGSLSDAVKVRGFYPAGAGELGDAVEAAVKKQSDNVVLIPISNWSLMGGGAAKDTIVWLPLDVIAETIVKLVELRKQLIDDVYQITGLSDIMRGSTVASETLGAQELKSQYGSVRIKDRTAELVRFARDLTRISAEIMAENFQQKTMLEMSQLDIKTDAQVAQEVAPLVQQLTALQAQIAQAMQDPEVQAMAQQDPEKAQQVLQQAQQQGVQLQGQITQLQQTVTIEKVMQFLRDQRLRPFVLDIETDSTIAPDENATKQRATEFITAVGAYMGQALPLVQAVPQAAPLMAEALKYVASQFRAGRELEGTIEEFADTMKQVAGQPKPEDPAVTEAKQKAQADFMERQANAQKTVLDAQNKAAQDDHDRQLAAAEANQQLQDKTALSQQQRAHAAEKHAQDMEKGDLELEKLHLEIEGVGVKTDAMVATTNAKIDHTHAQADAKAEQAEAEPDGEAAPAKPVRPARRSLRTEISDGHQQTAALVASVLKTVSEQNTEIVKALTAPKVIIKDAGGRPVGVQTMGLN